MERLKIAMLGKPYISWQGERIMFPFAKIEALLYYMIVKKSATRNELSGLLWGEMDDLAAKKNLRNTLYLLKKIIPCELLLTPSRSIILLNDAVLSETTDVERLQSGVSDALTVWTGEFLEGFYCKDAPLFEEWLDRQRELFKTLYIKLLTRHIVSLMNDKRYQQAEYYLQRLIAIDEYNESAYRALMKLYEKSGDTNKLVAMYQQLKLKLSSDLGVKISSRTEEIYNRVVHNKQLASIRPHSVAADVFFGRGHELQRLQAWAADFLAGACSGQVVILSGEQGVGKSTIVAQLSKQLSTGPLTILQIQGCQAEINHPYRAWNALFGQIVQMFKQEAIVVPKAWRQVIAYIFPAVAEHEASAVSSLVLTEHMLQPAVVETAMVGVLGKLAATRKIMLTIDDIQWLDQPSMSLLRNFLRTYSQRAAAVVTCRSEYLDAFGIAMEDWERRQGLIELPVAPFSQQEVVDFCKLAIAPDKLNAEMVGKLYEYTEGNALFLAECFKLIEAGQHFDQLSPRLQSVLKRRLDALSGKARTTLAMLSAFSHDADYSALEAVSGDNSFELVEAIEELEQRRLIGEWNSEHSKGPIYRFCHGLVKEFVYSSMSASRQQILHHKIARYLEQLIHTDMRAQGMYFAVRYHYLLAGDHMKALEYTIKLAERYSFPYYEVYPDLGDYLLYDTDQQYDKLHMSEHLEQVESLMNTLQQTVGEERLGRFKAAYLDMLGRYYIWRGEHAKGLQAAHRLLRLAAARGYSDYRLRGYQQVIFCGIQTGRFRLIEVFAEKLYMKAMEGNSKEKMAVAIRYKGLALIHKDIRAAETYYRQSIAMLKRIGLGQGMYDAHIAAAYNYIGDLRRMAGNLPEALRYYEKAMTFYRQRNVGEGLAVVRINAGYTAFQLGHTAKASEYLTAAVKSDQPSEGVRGCWSLRYHCILHCVLALLAVQQERPLDVAQHLQKADQYVQQHDKSRQQAIALRSKAQIRAAMEHSDVLQRLLASSLTASPRDYLLQSRQLFERLGDQSELALTPISI